jgi:hypothetical protein
MLTRVDEERIDVVDRRQRAEPTHVVRYVHLSHQDSVSPDSPDLAQHQRVDDGVSHGRDRSHVGPAEAPVRPDEHGHLAAVTAASVGYPAEVEHSVHRLVGDFERGLIIDDV